MPNGVCIVCGKITTYEKKRGLVMKDLRCECGGGLRKGGWKRSREARAKISRAKLGDKNPNYGKHLSEEQKKHLRDCLKGRPKSIIARKNIAESHLRGINHPNYGKSPSFETRLKLRISHAGDRAPSWKGGVSFEPYCQKFNNEFKERVREFWGRKCFLCGVPENGKRHDVHHVNYDPKVCCNDTPPLFVPLCHSCHLKTRGNREGWEAYLTEQILLATDGKTFFTREEMLEACR